MSQETEVWEWNLCLLLSADCLLDVISSYERRLGIEGQRSTAAWKITSCQPLGNPQKKEREDLQTAVEKEIIVWPSVIFSWIPHESTPSFYPFVLCFQHTYALLLVSSLARAKEGNKEWIMGLGVEGLE